MRVGERELVERERGKEGGGEGDKERDRYRVWPVPLQPIPGLIYNIPPFVMSQRGRTNPDVWAIATAIYLIKGEIAPVLLLFMFSFL